MLVYRMSISNALVLWAGCDQTKVDQLRAWQTSALESIAEGNGSIVASTTANGVSVSFNTGKLTVGEWFAVLTEAINLIDNPTSNRTRTTARFI